MKRMLVLLAAAAVTLAVAAPPARAADAELVRTSRRALDSLMATNPAARELKKKSRAVLVFPKMIKAGFLFGGQIGDGLLFEGDRVAGYYNSVAASYGLQVGGQVFGYALFFMNDGALDYLKKSSGWEIGSGPSVVVWDQGMGKSFSSTTLTQDVYAFIFNQKGLMAGIGIQGSKITRIDE
ncbi:MAG: lipid-binding SYLF domain-containing protein [Deltaproteobacteria bacterium]|nr:lipid-binding SYLF domain-containing protein [Deltaproteobacteria bacterium]